MTHAVSIRCFHAAAKNDRGLPCLLGTNLLEVPSTPLLAAHNRTWVWHLVTYNPTVTVARRHKGLTLSHRKILEPSNHLPLVMFHGFIGMRAWEDWDQHLSLNLVAVFCTLVLYGSCLNQASQMGLIKLFLFSAQNFSFYN